MYGCAIIETVPQRY